MYMHMPAHAHSYIHRGGALAAEAAVEAARLREKRRLRQARRDAREKAFWGREALRRQRRRQIRLCVSVFNHVINVSALWARVCMNECEHIFM